MRIERTFSIEYDDELGPTQMNGHDLVQCLNLGYSVREVFEVDDVTEHVAELEAQFAIVVERNEVLEDALCTVNMVAEARVPKPYEPEKRALP